MEAQPERPYKVIIVGGQKSGKTSFFRRWIYDEFLSAQHYVVSFIINHNNPHHSILLLSFYFDLMNLGIDFALKRMVDPAGLGENFLIKLWDIQGIFPIPFHTFSFWLLAVCCFASVCIFDLR